jgi:hypothetical protein
MLPNTVSDIASPPAHDLRRFVRCYDGALSAAFCTQMIDSFHRLARFHTRNGRGVRAGLEASAWTELDITPLSDQTFQGFFFEQIETFRTRYNADLGLTIAVPPTTLFAELCMKRYIAGNDEAFQPHFDAVNEVADRYLVFLWYLNDVDEGGETEFVDLGLRVQARAGRLLMFPPYWMFQHAGLPPRSNDKYIVSTYMRFPTTPVAR